MNLPELDTDAWIDLELAGTDPNSGFRYVNLCTVDSEGHPQARLIVVLRTRKRARSRSTRDIRTPKWREIDANPSVTVLAFDQARGLQLRLLGTVERHAPGSSVAADA
jgi:pyridoxamine 5'-phosphate oxidase